LNLYINYKKAVLRGIKFMKTKEEYRYIKLDPKIALPHSVCSEKGHAATAYLMSFVEACL